MQFSLRLYSICQACKIFIAGVLFVLELTGSFVQCPFSVTFSMRINHLLEFPFTEQPYCFNQFSKRHHPELFKFAIIYRLFKGASHQKRIKIILAFHFPDLYSDLIEIKNIAYLADVLHVRC